MQKRKLINFINHLIHEAQNAEDEWKQAYTNAVKIAIALYRKNFINT